MGCKRGRFLYNKVEKMDYTCGTKIQRFRFIFQIIVQMTFVFISQLKIPKSLS